MPITHAMKNTVIEIKKCKTDDAIIKMHNYLKREEKKISLCENYMSLLNLNNAATTNVIKYFE